MATMTTNQRENIFTAVKSMYTDVASCPDKTFHFPTGRLACEYLGYSAEQLDSLPAEAVGYLPVRTFWTLARGQEPTPCWRHCRSAPPDGYMAWT